VGTPTLVLSTAALVLPDLSKEIINCIKALTMVLYSPREERLIANIPEREAQNHTEDKYLPAQYKQFLSSGKLRIPALGKFINVVWGCL
jgi:hypothetical protein